MYLHPTNCRVKSGLYCKVLQFKYDAKVSKQSHHGARFGCGSGANRTVAVVGCVTLYFPNDNTLKASFNGMNRPLHSNARPQRNTIPFLLDAKKLGDPKKKKVQLFDFKNMCDLCTGFPAAVWMELDNRRQKFDCEKHSRHHCKAIHPFSNMVEKSILVESSQFLSRD